MSKANTMTGISLLGRTFRLKGIGIRGQIQVIRSLGGLHRVYEVYITSHGHHQTMRLTAEALGRCIGKEIIE